MRRFLTALMVAFVTSTPAADVWCRAFCVGPAPAETSSEASAGTHCALHKDAPSGPAIGGARDACTNLHGDTRVVPAAIKVARPLFALTLHAAGVPGLTDLLPASSASGQRFAPLARSSLASQSLQRRC